MSAEDYTGPSAQLIIRFRGQHDMDFRQTGKNPATAVAQAGKRLPWPLPFCQTERSVRSHSTLVVNGPNAGITGFLVGHNDTIFGKPIIKMIDAKWTQCDLTMLQL